MDKFSQAFSPLGKPFHPRLQAFYFEMVRAAVRNRRDGNSAAVIVRKARKIIIAESF
jgi:hypothetical protein